MAIAIIRSLRPNHHSALFIGEMLLRFGPVHGWWCFPFGRMIGLLQQIASWVRMSSYGSINSMRTHLNLAGQFEVTMMNSFCASANIRTFLDSPRRPDYLKPCKPITEQCYTADKRGTLVNDIRALENR